MVEEMCSDRGKREYPSKVGVKSYAKNEVFEGSKGSREACEGRSKRELRRTVVNPVFLAETMKMRKSALRDYDVSSPTLERMRYFGRTVF
jgi:hypothetical protein